MQILIVGAGDVGFQLAKRLAREQHDITLIDADGAKVRRAREQIDAQIIEGSGSSLQVLRQAGIEQVYGLLLRIGFEVVLGGDGVHDARPFVGWQDGAQRAAPIACSGRYRAARMSRIRCWQRSAMKSSSRRVLGSCSLRWG